MNAEYFLRHYAEKAKFVSGDEQQICRIICNLIADVVNSDIVLESTKQASVVENAIRDVTKTTVKSRKPDFVSILCIATAINTFK